MSRTIESSINSNWYPIDCEANKSGFCRSEDLANGIIPSGAILITKSKPGLNGEPEVLTYACGGTSYDFREEKREMIKKTCSGCPNSPLKGEKFILEAIRMK